MIRTGKISISTSSQYLEVFVTCRELFNELERRNSWQASFQPSTIGSFSAHSLSSALLESKCRIERSSVRVYVLVVRISRSIRHLAIRLNTWPIYSIRHIAAALPRLPCSPMKLFVIGHDDVVKCDRYRRSAVSREISCIGHRQLNTQTGVWIRKDRLWHR